MRILAHDGLVPGAALVSPFAYLTYQLHGYNTTTKNTVVFHCAEKLVVYA